MFRLVKSSRVGVVGSSKAKHLSKFQKSLLSKSLLNFRGFVYVNYLFFFVQPNFELFFPVKLQNSKEESSRLQGGTLSSQEGKKKFWSEKIKIIGRCA